MLQKVVAACSAVEYYVASARTTVFAPSCCVLLLFEGALPHRYEADTVSCCVCGEWGAGCGWGCGWE